MRSNAARGWTRRLHSTGDPPGGAGTLARVAETQGAQRERGKDEIISKV
jgi:hypothetical protein